MFSLIGSDLDRFQNHILVSFFAADWDMLQKRPSSRWCCSHFKKHYRMVGISISHPTRIFLQSLQSLNSCFFLSFFSERISLDPTWTFDLCPLIRWLWPTHAPSPSNSSLFCRWKSMFVFLIGIHSISYLVGWKSLPEFVSWTYFIMFHHS